MTPGEGAAALQRELLALLGADGVPESTRGYGGDAAEAAGLRGKPDAVVAPGSADELARVVEWCYERGVAIVPRGGGTGYTGGAAPIAGGVVVSLERLARVRAFDPGAWRIEVEAGVTTATVHRLARENGLYYPPDPGAAEQSQIGGNIATNAGGPHAFKYGVTGAWVTGLEAVVAPGELISVGGPVRKDVAGYDLRSLLVGSEGTLGVITAAWLRLIPVPEVALPVIAFYPDCDSGCAAITGVRESGLVPATLEYLDGGAVAAAAGSLPGGAPEGTGFMIIAEADGDQAAAEALAAELAEVLEDGALAARTVAGRDEVEALWHWRGGVSLAVTAQRGGKLSEDIAVPVDRLREAIAETVAIGSRHGLEATSWGHAGDANIHATFLVDPASESELDRAATAAEDLFELAVRLGGTISGEHGLGWIKRGQLARQWRPAAIRLHEDLKRAFDPKGLLNPGKKAGRIEE